MSDSCARCGRTFRRHECLQIADGRAYCQVACADEAAADDRCAQCDRVLHADAHASDPCQHCGHDHEHAAELLSAWRALRSHDVAAVFDDDSIPF